MQTLSEYFNYIMENIYLRFIFILVITLVAAFLVKLIIQADDRKNLLMDGIRVLPTTVQQKRLRLFRNVSANSTVYLQLFTKEMRYGLTICPVREPG